jgi:hypothetical protein
MREIPIYSASGESIGSFHCCCSLDGATHDVSFYRQNGRLVPRIDPALLTFPSLEPEASNDYAELVEEVCQNLTVIERRTWLLILDGWSISRIAEEEQVSRPAVYSRLRSMARRNPYVPIWWRLRQNNHSHDDAV